MITITKQQVEVDREYSSELCYRLIKDYVDTTVYTKPTKRYIKRVQLAVVYDSILNSWEQGDFTNEEYINYLTSMGYINLIDRIRSL